ncbi:unnamed protein product [Effrenium voratum]|uniref:Uncharacterized protein n=1 Tax=Effrenium voratum TaxID=2562239 RepID=A0AA36IAD2_9DINO|nr:unnamed protein product [Effrenium voratum]
MEALSLTLVGLGIGPRMYNVQRLQFGGRSNGAVMEGFAVEPEVEESAASPKHFDLSAEDNETEKENGAESERASSFEQAFTDPVAAGSANESGPGLEQIHARLKFLSADDQKTVCRRECQLAQQKQEALARQLQATIARYHRVITTHRAVAAIGPAEADEEVLQKYQERQAQLQGLFGRLEPTLSLPRLTPLERAKGFAFSSYATTAAAANKLKDQLGQDGPAPVLESARSAFTSFASRLSRRGYAEPA